MEPAIAYFSMEIAIDPAIPTYSGGLGILAGDTLRSAADEGVPLVAVSLLHRKGYLRQTVDPSGWQRESPEDWPVAEKLRELPARASVSIETRTVVLRAWQYDIAGIAGTPVTALLLDADLPENSPWDRTLTDYLYGGDGYYRICQEVILGIGGVRMLRALGHNALTRFHMNEGHAAFLTLELLEEEAGRAGHTAVSQDDIEAVRARCIFTTHTPVPAGHDKFPMDLVGRVLGTKLGRLETSALFTPALLGDVLDAGPAGYDTAGVFRSERILNLTKLALSLSHYVNGVAKRHAEVSQRMFAKHHIDEITNGVHAATWVCPAFHRLYDVHIPGWEADNFSLRYALNIDRERVWAAHQQAKAALLDTVARTLGVRLDPEALTLGFARRFTPYKRADLLLTDIGRLRDISRRCGRLQVIYGGKAHANDIGGKEAIQRVIHARESLKPEVDLVFLENYEMETARLLVAGADVWLNTPLPPLEASGTSGMKAALNGVPSLSVLDGWWLEGCIDGVTGWPIGEASASLDPDTSRDGPDAASLYDRLENAVAPLYYQHRQHFIGIMRHSIALNGSFFNTQRMIQQYVLKAYFE